MEMNMNILVTGGIRGIGAGIVRCLAEAKHNVAFCGRTEAAQGEAKAEEISRATGVKCRYYRCDIADADDRAALLESFLRDFTTLDALVNNAGVAPQVRADLLDMGEESFLRLLRINLMSPFFLTQLAAKKMIEEQKNAPAFRCIVNIGSVSADYASINRGEYCISKAGVAMATKLFACRLADEQIPVYELRPGVIHSDMTSAVQEKYDKMIAGGLTLQRRWGEPEDIGKAVRMLVSGDLAYSTGTVINVDGGLTIERF